MADCIFFYVNGKEIIERNIEPEWTLLWYLRNKLRLTGPTLGCGEGSCGSCTVLISQCIDRESGEIEHRTVNGCLAPLCSVDGCHVITVEGLGSLNKSSLRSTQNRLSELSSSQCGFCTPGMVMSLYGTISSKSNFNPTIADIEEAFDGHLCRSTGYRSILNVAKRFASDTNKIHYDNSSSLRPSTTFDKCLLFPEENSLPFDQIQFPEKLRDYIPQSIHIKGCLLDWYRPISLNELIFLRHTYPGDESKLVFGNTRVEIERKSFQMKYRRLICITHIKKLQELKRTNNSFYLGAGVTFTQLKSKLIQWNNDKQNNDGGICQALLDQLKHFGSTQIRNVASIGGNLIGASPISEINPVLEAARAILEFHRVASPIERYMPLQEFFLGNNRVLMSDNEVLVAIHIPLPNSLNKSFIRSFKQARRRDNIKEVISAAFQVELEPANSVDNQWRIVSICFSFGGMASKTIMATNTQQQLIGFSWTRATINRACQLLLEEIPLDQINSFRRTLIQSFLFKFYTHVSIQLNQPSNDSNYLSTTLNYDKEIFHVQHTIPERPSLQRVAGSLLPHRSAYLHTPGEAIYIDDISSLTNILHAKLVLSTEANSRIKYIDIESASKVSGFVSFVSSIDVPGSNKTNGILSDEEVFVSSISFYVGSIIGVVLCESELAAEMASNLVQIDYELFSSKILTIDDAIAHQSYFGDEIYLRKGDIIKSFLNAENILEGELFIAGQEHFYMETNACIVVPSNDENGITLYLPTENATVVQELVALVLGRDVAHITCHTKRIGKPFGGKQSRIFPPCLAIAVAAVKVGRPVRINLERHVDISITGHRHPFKINYKVAFTNEGRFMGVDIRMWNNAGWSLDGSEGVMQLAMLHMSNSYQFANMEIRGRVCKTHLPSNTAFHCFGSAQAMLASETIVEHVIAYLKSYPLTIRSLNLYKEGDITHYGHVMGKWNIPRILNELTKSSDFFQRQINVEQFNHLNIYRKRGLTLIPVHFDIDFILQFLNQTPSSAHIYKDGSVVLTHGNAQSDEDHQRKIISIAAEVLGCHVDRIQIREITKYESISSNLNGMNIKHACELIRQRLDRLLLDKNVRMTWEDLVEQAYFYRIDLSARGFYIAPEMFDIELTENRANFNCLTQAAAVSEVELDVLTGNWHLLRVDILIDVGTSLNPQIDIGQIKGAFMQGIGLFTRDEFIFGDHTQNQSIQPDQLFSRGLDTYKTPSFTDVPIDFRVSFLANSSNRRTVYASKGLDEPLLLLATSVFFALKQACIAHRQQQGLSDYFTLHSPATLERLRMVCATEFQPKGSY